MDTASTKDFLEGAHDHHVISGPKGSGKSLLLFRKAVQIRQKDGVLFAPTRVPAFAPRLAFAGAEKWEPYWTLLDKNGRSRRADWGSLWAWALGVTVLSRWSDHVKDSPLFRVFMKDAEPFLATVTDENPYNLVSAELNSLADESRRSKGLAVLQQTEGLTRVLEKYANQFPPTYLFLDNQDETFEEKPDYWHRSGFGCFLAIRELHASTGHRVHVFMTLRSEVADGLGQSQDVGKWSGSFFRIGWNDSDLFRVLESRAARLQPGRLRAAELDQPMAAFLGHEFVSHRLGLVMRIPLADTPGRRTFVRFDEYLLRHTFRRPRDLIVLCNKIIEARREPPLPGGDEIQLVREAVDRAAAQIIARGYLEEVKDRWPWSSSPDGNLWAFLMRYVRKNVIPAREMDAIETDFAAELKLPRTEVRPFRELARLGIVGWPVQDLHCQRRTVQRFVCPGDPESTIPDAVEYYLVHPAFYGQPFRVRVVPGFVVGHGLPFRPKPSRSYYSCFLSYGSCDHGTAVRIHDDLRSKGVVCWFHPESAEPNAKTWDEIRREMKHADKILCLCSSKAFHHSGFTAEVMNQASNDRDKFMVLALDEGWARSVNVESKAATMAREVLVEVNPIPFWHLGFDDGLNALLTKLKRGRRQSPGDRG